MRRSAPAAAGKRGTITHVDSASAISFQNILFQLGSDEFLNEDSHQQVKHIASAMRRTIGARFLVEGHTCDLGEKESNQSLSEARAKRIVRELIRQGISAERLRPVGYGSTSPVAPNDSEENRQKNRRVMIYKRA